MHSHEKCLLAASPSQRLSLQTDFKRVYSVVGLYFRLKCQSLTKQLYLHEQHSHESAYHVVNTGLDY